MKIIRQFCLFYSLILLAFLFSHCLNFKQNTIRKNRTLNPPSVNSVSSQGEKNGSIRCFSSSSIISIKVNDKPCENINTNDKIKIISNIPLGENTRVQVLVDNSAKNNNLICEFDTGDKRKAFTDFLWKANNNNVIATDSANVDNIKDGFNKDAVIIKSNSQEAKINFVGYLRFKSDSTYRFVVDNILKGVFVNNILQKEIKGENNYKKEYSYNNYFGPGDVLKICGENSGAYNVNTNPAQIIADISYTNSQGVASIISSNKETWKCSNNQSFTSAAEINNPRSYKPTTINPNAKYIWAPEVSSQTACCIYEFPVISNQSVPLDYTEKPCNAPVPQNTSTQPLPNQHSLTQNPNSNENDASCTRDKINIEVSLSDIKNCPCLSKFLKKKK